MKKTFRVATEAFIQPFTVARKIPANSSYLIPYAKAVCWRGTDWWVGLQWHDAKHAYLYCIEILSSQHLHVPLECLRTDTQWLYMLKGELSLEDTCTSYKLQHMRHMQYLTLQDKLTLSFPKGRHVVVGFTLAQDWLARYITDGLDFLPTVSCLRGSYVNSSIQTSPAILSEILQLLTLPRSARLVQDAAIYQPIARLVELERGAHLTTSTPSPEISNRSRELADAVHQYVTHSIAQGIGIPSIAMLAEHFYVHPDHLSRCHRTHYGQSLKPFIREQLLHRAHARLLAGEKVGDVAYSLGFWDVSAFSKDFKQFFGISPSEVGLLKPSFSFLRL